MEYLENINPLKIYQGIRDGTIAEKIDNRILSALAVYAGLKLAYNFGYRPLYSFYKYFIRPQRDLYKRYGGGWVVITGATGGAGTGFYKVFAEMGFNLLLISRREEMLAIAATNAKRINPNIEVKTITFNFNRPYSPKDYKPVIDVINEIKDIAVLVNNVGFDCSHDGKTFHDHKDEAICSVHQINTTALIYCTKYCLKHMIKRGDKKSAIINMSSMATFNPSPADPMYTTSKWFVLSFGQCIAKTKEYKNIDFLNLTPCGIKSGMNLGKMLLTIDGYEFAKAAVGHLGYGTQEIGHWKHQLYTKMMSNPITGIILYLNIINNMDSLATNPLQTPVNFTE
jgi:uncharacterized protein